MVKANSFDLKRQTHSHSGYICLSVTKEYMTQVIYGELSPLTDSADESVLDFFESQGMRFDFGFRDKVFVIELHTMPLALADLIDAGHFESAEQLWTIISITPKGIALFVINRYAGDGYMFIPFENIVSLHTIKQKYIEDTKTKRLR